MTAHLGPGKIVGHRPVYKVSIGEAGADDAQNVQGSKLREQEVHPQRLQFFLIGLEVAACWISIARLELAEGGEEALQVSRALVVENVEIQSQDGRALELGGHSADHQEVDSVAEQHPEQTQELNAPGLVHAGARRDRLPNPAGVVAFRAGSGSGSTGSG